jgi:hypothetical protein
MSVKVLQAIMAGRFAEELVSVTRRVGIQGECGMTNANVGEGPMSIASVVAKALSGLSSYALLGWIYIAANSITHPITMHLGLTHFASFPHEESFGIICFTLSAILYFASRCIRPFSST